MKEIAQIKLALAIAKAERESPQTTLGKILYRSGYTKRRFQEDLFALTSYSCDRTRWLNEDAEELLLHLVLEKIENGNRNPFEVFFAEPFMEYVRHAPGYNPGRMNDVAEVIAGIDFPARLLSIVEEPGIREWLEQVSGEWKPPVKAFFTQDLLVLPERVFSGEIPLEKLGEVVEGRLGKRDVEYVIVSESPLAGLVKSEERVCLVLSGGPLHQVVVCHGEDPVCEIPPVFIEKSSGFSGMEAVCRRIFGEVERTVPDEKIGELARSAALRIKRNVFFPSSNHPGISAEVLLFIGNAVGLIDMVEKTVEIFGNYEVGTSDRSRLKNCLIEELSSSRHPVIRRALEDL